jgi:plastocyanin
MRFVIHRTRRWFGGALMSAAAAFVAGARPGAARSGGATHEVAIRKFAFVPRRLVVATGDTVVWRNEDYAPHTATASDQSWNTGEIARGHARPVRFEAPGRMVYVCAYHPHMKGEVVVTARDS